MIEIWIDIKDYEGLYQVSNLGRVRSLDRNGKGKGNGSKGKIIKPVLNKNGYLKVTLCKNGKRKSYRVHRLVAEAFKPNPHNYPTVDHINRIRTDNRADNLRWAPWILQARNSSAKERVQKNRKDESKPVEQYTLDGVFVGEYPSQMEASRQTGICNVNISKCCRDKIKKAGGYVWRYKD